MDGRKELRCGATTSPRGVSHATANANAKMPRSSKIPLGEKFGALPSAIMSLYDYMRDHHDDVMRLIGVSFHVGSGAMLAGAYANAIDIARNCMKGINETVRRNNADGRNGVHNYGKLWLLDIGGGFPGFDGGGADGERFSTRDVSRSAAVEGKGGLAEGLEAGKFTTRDIADAVNPLVEEIVNKDGITVIAEPGRFFVEAAFAVCCKIYSVRNESSDNPEYFVNQGIEGVFKDVLLCNEVFIPFPLRFGKGGGWGAQGKPGLFEGAELLISTVVGPGGENDIICRDVALPRLAEGDWLVFDRMGAYTVAIAAENTTMHTLYLS